MQQKEAEERSFRQMPQWSARLWDEMRESPVRHYVWGFVIVLMGVCTIFGYWFLFGG